MPFRQRSFFIFQFFFFFFLPEEKDCNYTIPRQWLCFPLNFTYNKHHSVTEYESYKGWLNLQNMWAELYCSRWKSYDKSIFFLILSSQQTGYYNVKMFLAFLVYWLSLIAPEFSSSASCLFGKYCFRHFFLEQQSQIKLIMSLVTTFVVTWESSRLTPWRWWLLPLCPLSRCPKTQTHSHKPTVQTKL